MNQLSQSLIFAERPDPAILLLRLNRPRQRNALSVALLGQLADALRAARSDESVRCVVLSGDERSFSPGADINEMQQHGFEALSDPSRHNAWDIIAGFPKPLIAAVRGVCLGGGLELAMLADILLVAEDCVLAQPEIRIGIIPGDGATQRLTRIVGKSLAMQMVLTGEPISARQAVAAGFASEMLPASEMLGRALAIARVISNRAPIAVRLAKESIQAAYETPLSAGLAIERRAIRYAFTTDDQKEGMAAFVEKRPPLFSGR
ncbi:enoyl-CoA hydratase/isomerase family protein [Bradyrhizobium sp. 138]|uniref:enoyl-CoA hydratase-related protein n=1 Tax=Bradyrhizobium sp. 138 TaxID=2782615 RepID=UPI001FF9D8EC|nr:enoyl-CoA hydratase-related protein [Bradyrhizobium sp. 138]MCK1734326.1 enoyl-CoA hydratase/isomerase family protein [Bradyrhizobium sp. 138]